ncbi:aminotransferase class V-fold PLP-dependent enzyme [Roseimaritima sediminicola]|uniref:aminotransferase class V-fold PLP-dependent enzyme n=1 Tax=Roseimaritima sediminicola TaxID=2662066 RepID=UPI001386F4A4|nr:aminotransferase class V-fold PLP-dependent enzyme [Roseimaritima sediminicola]
MNPATRVYLDNAATSWPKPPVVYEAVLREMRDSGAAAGRGGYGQAVAAADTVTRTRAAIADLIGAETGRSIVITANGTAALNTAILGALPAGRVRQPAHVVTTAAEHNSVLRPLWALQTRGHVQMDVVDCDQAGRVDADRVLAAVRPETQMVAVTHASNVTGAIQPVETIGRALEDHPAWFLCDAAQTFGYHAIDVRGARIDLLAAPGHKGGMGPLGTGFLYVAPARAADLVPTLWGGTGGNSQELTMPEAAPERFEAGNLNVPAIAGWLAGLQWLKRQTDRCEHLAALANQLDEGLQPLAAVRCLGSGGTLPLRSVTFAGLPPADVGAILDAEFGIQVRTGLHCAARIHAALGTDPDGTVRVSAGHLTTPEEIEILIDAVAAIAGEM